MESATKTIEPPATANEPAAANAATAPAGRARLGLTWRRARFAVLVYLASRALLLVVAIVDGALRHHAVLNELANWDGMLYRSVANLGSPQGFYPHHVFHYRTNLGFFPLYPLVIWTVSQPVRWLGGHSAIWSITFAGVLVSTVGGLIATLLIQRLADGWWGPRAARRAVLLFCLFPGSVVFSMVYAEGIAIPLAAGCILALERRRWVLAGALAALATASEPEAVVLVAVCAAAALRQIHAARSDRRRALPSLAAPVLSLSGLLAVGAFFWAWAGSPVATFTTQHYGWNERTDALALVHLVTRFAAQVSFAHFNHPTINLNLPVGIIGAVFLAVGLWLLARSKRRISLEAAVWTLGISFLAITSEYVPPNPRLLITAFPAVLVFAYRLRGAAWTIFISANAVLLAGLSALTFVGITLRP